MRTRVSRTRAIAAATQVKHPELTRPTLAGIRSVAKREGISIMTQPLSPGSEGWAMEIFGKPCIMMSSLIKNRRRRLYVLLHEFAHVQLGHIYERKLLEKRRIEVNQRFVKRSGKWWYVTDPSPVEDAIEREADLFVEIPLGRAK
jgi:hypothetical protein